MWFNGNWSIEAFTLKYSWTRLSHSDELLLLQGAYASSLSQNPFWSQPLCYSCTLCCCSPQVYFRHSWAPELGALSRQWRAQQRHDFKEPTGAPLPQHEAPPQPLCIGITHTELTFWFFLLKSNSPSLLHVCQADSNGSSTIDGRKQKGHTKSSEKLRVLRKYTETRKPKEPQCASAVSEITHLKANRE